MQENKDTVKSNSIIRPIVLAALGAVISLSAFKFGSFAFLLSAVAGALSAFGVLVCSTKHKPIITSIAIILMAAVIPATWFLSKTLYDTVSAVLPLAILVILIAADKKRASRSSTITVIALFAAVIEVILLLLMVYDAYSAINLSVFEDIYSKLRNPEWILAIYEELPSIDNETLTTLKETFTESYLTELVNSVVNLLPMLLALVGLFLGFISTAIFKFLSSSLSPEEHINYSEWKIKMSKVSAVVFLISFIVALATPSFNEVVFFSAQNIAFMIIPGFIISGVSSLIATKTCSTPMLILLLVFAFIYGAYSVFAFIAIISAIQTLMRKETV